MKKNDFLKKMLMFSAFALTARYFEAQTLVHYWNFNNNTSEINIKTPTVSITPTKASIDNFTNTNTYVDFEGGTKQNFDVENLNARNGDVAGAHLRYNYPIGGFLLFSLPTTGYENPVVKFTTRRSGSGAGTQEWTYSTDGSTFIPLGEVIPKDANPELITFDLSTIAGSSNNPNFKLKVEFIKGNGGEVGNNRFDNFTLDASAIGGEDTTPPSVVYNPTNNATGISTSIQPTITFNEDVRLIDDSPITNENAQNLVELKSGNASGTSIPFTTTVTNNSITIIPTSAFTSEQSVYYALKPNVIEDFNNNAVASSTSSTFTTGTSKVSFTKNFEKVNENAGTHSVVLTIENPVSGSVDVVVKPAPFSTADANDFTLTTQTVQLTPEMSTYTITIPIVDDIIEEQYAEYFVLSLENPVNTTLGTNKTSTIYIIDNDKSAPIPNKELELNYIGSFDPSGNNSSSTEIVVHDPATQKLFVISSITDVLDIVDFSNPTMPTKLKTISMTPYGGITSVAVKNGIVAVASPNENPQQNGSVVFFNTNGEYLNKVTVGVLPDMVVFTPDGTKVMTANEGEPNDSYSIDPEGSISIIDISVGVGSLSQSNVTTLDFTAYNSQEATLIASGIRKVKASTTFSQNIEPEYITVTSDSKKAYVSLQENNAIAEINLESNTISDLWALGTKDMSLPGNGFDASDNNGEILIANWPVKTYLTPDAIASYKVGGTNYIVTANEGDEKDISGFSERTTVGANGYQLDSALFPNSELLKASYNLGRFRVTNVNGNTDGDAQFEEIYALGSRSFSIFNADTKQIVFDSGDDFERYTAANYASVFNADNESSNAPKSRSRAKGPEPEGVTLATIAGKTFAFITLERVGGVMVYDVTNPNDAKFVDYKNPRSTSAYGGDNGPEGVTYIASENTTTGKGYILVANEISGTLSIYEVAPGATLATDGVLAQTKTFNVFPNPVKHGEALYFNRAADYVLFDLSGKKVSSGNNALIINTQNLTPGVYIVKTSEGVSKKVIVK